MTIHKSNFREIAKPDIKPIDELLAEIAARIQLTPTLHDLAVARYKTLAQLIDGEGSPLQGLVDLVYPQGSMGFGATIRSRSQTDIFDIDVLVEARLPTNTSPMAALKLLEQSIRRDKDSRYYGMTKRHTRCVTVTYAEMSIDFTIQKRRWDLGERSGEIPHAKEEEAESKHKWVLTNPYGFAEWFEEQTPAESWFAEDYRELSYSLDSGKVVARADAEPVPDQVAVYEKSLALVSLQLLKRWLQRTFEHRPHRWPASILVSKLVAESAGYASTLVTSLIHHADFIREKLEQAERSNILLVETNPRLSQERFTDRWPTTQSDQRLFVDDLRKFSQKMRALSGNVDLETLQEGLAELFGERVVGDVVSAFVEKRHTNIQLNEAPVASRTGRVMPSISVAATPLITPRPHRFYGEN